MRGDGDVEDVDEDWPPKDERDVGDDDSFDFPLREGSSPAESLRRRAKVLLPKFCLEAVALRPESPPLIFSRSRVTIYQKMGTGGVPRGPQPIRARPGGPGMPWWVVPTWGASSGSFQLQYFLLNVKIISVKFQLHWSCAE